MAALLREPFSFVDEPLDASVDYETDRVYSDTVRYNRIDLVILRFRPYYLLVIGALGG